MRHWQHTQALARAGHDVTVVTSYVQHKERTVPERYRGRRMVHEVEDGIDVWRTYSTPGYGRDLRSRISNYGTFAWWSALAGMRTPARRGGGLLALAAVGRRGRHPGPGAAERASCWRCATSSRTRRSRWGC